MHNQTTRIWTTLRYLAVIPLIALGILSILATGGGGGGTPAPTPPPAPTVALDAGNAEQVAGVALNQILGSSSLGNALPSASASAVGTSTGVTHRTTLGQLTAKLTQRLAAQLAPAVSPAQMLTETFLCLISGSVTITLGTDGTSANITFNACEDFPGEIINGSMSLSGLTVGFDSDGRVNFISATASVNLTFSVAGHPDIVVTGSFSITETTTFVAAFPSTTTTITGTNLVATSGGETLQLFNFSFTDTFDLMSSLATSDGDFTMDCTVIGGVVAVLTPIAFQTASATLPDSGQTEITGANGSRIVVTAIGNELAPVGNQVMLEIDADGDGSSETTINTTWTALDQDCNNHFRITGFGTATIDGVISPGEWDNAGSRNFLVNVPEGGTTPGTLFVMNDTNNLYLAVRFDRTAADAGNSATFEFDNDHGGGATEDGDDVLLINPNLIVPFRDNVRIGPFGKLDTTQGGTNDGAGVFANDGTFTIYEFSHPLDSTDDANDFSLSLGDTVGFTLFVRTLDSENVIADTGFPTLFLAPFLFSDIVIAGS